MGTTTSAQLYGSGMVVENLTLLLVISQAKAKLKIQKIRWNNMQISEQTLTSKEKWFSRHKIWKQMVQQIDLQNVLHLYKLILEVQILYFNFPIMFSKLIFTKASRVTHMHASTERERELKIHFNHEG